MKKFAVIVAAGIGSRMGNATPKQFMDLLGKPVFLHTVEAFAAAYADLFIVLVMHPLHVSKAQEIVDAARLQQRTLIMEGGDTRAASVKRGLAAVPDEAIVLVHDAARCLITTRLIHRCVEAAIECGSAIPVIPVTDSIRQLQEHGSRPVDRSSLRVVQTPQVFQAAALKDAYNFAEYQEFTDDASVFEHAGGAVTLVDGEPINIKITQPGDLEIAKALKTAGGKAQ